MQQTSCIFLLFNFKKNTNASYMKKNAFSSAILLSFGGIICKFMGAVYKIPLANILGAEGIGIYQLAYPLYAFLLVFVSGGIPYSLSCFVAKARAEGKQNKISGYFYSAFFYSFALGICFALFMICFSKVLANFQGNALAWQSYVGFGLSILFSCLIPCFRGLFQGYENYIPTFVSQILEQLAKLVLGLFFSYVLAKRSLQLGVFGASLGVLAGELIAFFYLLVCFLSNKKKYIFENTIYKNDAKKFFKFFVGIMLASIITPFLNVYQSFVVIPVLESLNFTKNFATSVYGIQTGMINPITNFPLVFSSALAIVLMPNLGYLFSKDKEKAKQMLCKSLKSVFVLSVPCMIGLFVLAKPILSLVFSSLDQNMMDIAQNFLKISAFSILFMVLSQVCTIALQGAIVQWKAFWCMFVFAIFYVVLLPIFLALFGIYGFALCSVLCYGFLATTEIFFLKKIYMIKLEFKTLVVPFIASVFMGVLTNFIYRLLYTFSNVLAVFVCILIAILFYFLALFIFGIITKKELLFFVKKTTK